MAEITQQNAVTAVLYDPKKQDASLYMRSRFSGEVPRFDPQQLANSIKHLIPVAVSDKGVTPIKITKIDGEPLTSRKLLDDAKKLGIEHSIYNLGIYNASKVGMYRKLNNAELVTGYPLYGDEKSSTTERLSSLQDTMKHVPHFAQMILKNAERFGEAVRNDCYDDIQKLSVLRTHYLGRHLSLPASPDLIGRSYPRRFLELLKIVVRHKCELTNHDLPSRAEAMLMMTDTKETAIGAPSFASAMLDEHGLTYHEKRLITLADMPVPDYSRDPSHWLNSAYAWGSSLGLPDPAMTFSAAVSYRQGAKGHKPIPLWIRGPHGYHATHESLSLESFQRLVYPASHALNVVLTPAVVQMKRARKRKLGMYHTPELMSKWVDKMNKQGHIALESDFSNYDMHVSADILSYVARLYSEYSSKFKWEFKLLEYYFMNSGVIYPSFESDDPFTVSFFKRNISLLSGTLSTSEMGSDVAIAANLYGFEKQMPNVVNDWIAGRFIIADQSDDVISTHMKHLDIEKFEEDMWDLRIKLKIKEGYVFLKKILPIGQFKDRLSTMTAAGAPLWSRQLQQTFFNEADYTGSPDALIRLALLARSERLDANPVSSPELIRDWQDYLNTFSVFKPIITHLFDGISALSSSDQEVIMKYSMTKGGEAWLSQIISRADSDPNAQLLLQSLQSIGFNYQSYDDTAVSQRKSYLDAMNRKPDAASRLKMLGICKWLH